ncbi:energy transducer TonB [Hymenobacter sp. BT175]|uniref:energy transducer TonB n=1 Tax=Hymenobacter translucens TaxID=2886507 RepID=UPI001D0E1DD6|nr:TonB family protein [Hymenobacter translucens]MCC2548142.1 energy transducer TonB [Hymenobacter translucens]
MKQLTLLLFVLAGSLTARAQQPAAPAKQPIELKPGQVKGQRKPTPNRPDVPPQFVGGAKALGEFFQLNVKYPEAAGVKKIMGNVVTAFTVEADGRISNPTVVTSLSPECDAEALRVLALMPAWKPATRRGEPMPIQVRLPIPFGNSSTLVVEKQKGKVKFE